MIKVLLFITINSFFYLTLHAQELEPTKKLTLYELKLVNIKGGVFKNIEVSFKNDNDGAIYKATSNNMGIVKILLPYDGNYEVKMSNYYKKRKIPLPGRPNISLSSTFKYSAVTESFASQFPLSKNDRLELQKKIASYPDTIYCKPSLIRKRKASTQFAKIEISLKDLKKGNLIGEEVYFVGRTRAKTFMSKTNKDGYLNVLLPKGDTYDMNFKYDEKYALLEIDNSSGINTQKFDYSYLGTKEIERRMEVERQRLLAYERKLEKERKAHEAYLKKEGITEEEYLKREAKRMEDERIAYKSRIEERRLRQLAYEADRAKAIKGHEDYLKKEGITEEEFQKREEEDRKKRMNRSQQERSYLISTVLERNKQWKDKLIVCDLTGSMSPYASQLIVWYKLNYLKDKNLQFVFFNDGDNKRDSEKVIGNTGGIYYAKSEGLDHLVKIMGKVQYAGSGGDGPENNVEALIKGTKQAINYKDIIMVADNNAPVKDIQLISKFNTPVHIIVCGATGSFIHPDYLEIALKTKGTIHTIEEDIVALSELTEGKEIIILGLNYKMMRGKLIRIDKT